MPEFNKNKYWERRQKGVRGQGGAVFPSKLSPDYMFYGEYTKKSDKKPGRYALRKHTKRARKLEVAQ